MEAPAKLRRKIVLLAMSPGKTKVLLKKDDSEWNLPNSHLHWPLGRRKVPPIDIASHLLKDFTLSLSGDLKSIKKNLTKFSKRSKLLSGGFVFMVYEGINITDICELSNRVRKHLNINEKIEMHDISEIQKINSHGKYGSTTIEAIRYLTI